MVEITQYSEDLDRVEVRTESDYYVCRFCPGRGATPDDVDHCRPCPVVPEKADN